MIINLSVITNKDNKGKMYYIDLRCVTNFPYISIQSCIGRRRSRGEKYRKVKTIIYYKN